MADNEKKKYYFEQHILELSRRADEGNYPVFTDFLTTGEQTAVCRLKQKIKKNTGNISVVMWGGHDDCSHVVAGFLPDGYPDYDRASLFPVSCILIEPLDYRYAEQIGHRDYLGAVLALGTKRSKIGDIRIEDQKAYLFCKKEIASFIQEQLSAVKHTIVSCQFVSDLDRIPKQKYDVAARTVASLRLDNIVAAMAGISRGRASDLVSMGKVMVNSEEKTSVSFSCRDGFVISIRGYGKYRLECPDNPLTKKGKHKIQIYKYI